MGEHTPAFFPKDALFVLPRYVFVDSQQAVLPLSGADIGAFRQKLSTHSRKVSKKRSALSDVCCEAGDTIAHLFKSADVDTEADIRRIVEVLTSMNRKGSLSFR